jgi:hypothetical protein
MPAAARFTPASIPRGFHWRSHRDRRSGEGRFGDHLSTLRRRSSVIRASPISVPGATSLPAPVSSRRISRPQSGTHWRTPVELRGEAFNVFNNVNFTRPNTTLTSASFGDIFRARAAQNSSDCDEDKLSLLSESFENRGRLSDGRIRPRSSSRPRNGSRLKLCDGLPSRFTSRRRSAHLKEYPKTQARLSLLMHGGRILDVGRHGAMLPVGLSASGTPFDIVEFVPRNKRRLRLATSCRRSLSYSSVNEVWIQHLLVCKMRASRS